MVKANTNSTNIFIRLIPEDQLFCEGKQFTSTVFGLPISCCFFVHKDGFLLKFEVSVCCCYFPAFCLIFVFLRKEVVFMNKS